jgi:HAD superfamily hydrolase (TIGR01450 family)
VSGALVDGYDLLIFDLDGVVYLGDQPVRGAVEAIARLHEFGTPLVFATNNASRRAAEVAALLNTLGVPAAAQEVATSAQAASSLLAQQLPTGSPVLVVGALALAEEVAAAGLSPVREAAGRPAAVVQGYGPGVGWADLAEASVAIRAGALWVATNMDRTLPSPRGPLPGNGALVAALATALGRIPDLVVGKPEPTLFAQVARRAGAHRPLTVGDRLDTDIEGARRAGMDSVLVLTGVHRAVDLVRAPAAQRPTHVAFDLSGLFEPDEALRIPDEPVVGGWKVTRADDVLLLDGAGIPLDALRALCAAAWAGQPPTAITPCGAAAAEALAALELD